MTNIVERLRESAIALMLLPEYASIGHAKINLHKRADEMLEAATEIDRLRQKPSQLELEDRLR